MLTGSAILSTIHILCKTAVAVMIVQQLLGLNCSDTPETSKPCLA